MIKSMTGYGRGECPSGGGKVVAEIRSLNGKSLDLSVRSSQLYRAIENRIRAIVGPALLRGKVELTISYDGNQSQSGSTVINRKAFGSYYRELLSVAKEIGMPLDNEQLLGVLTRMPEVIGGERTTVDPAEFEAVICAVGEAVAALDSFRIQEGGVLMNDIINRTQTIGELLRSVEQYEGERIEVVRSRLADNLTRAQVNVDQNRFEAEIIYFLEKFDVTEEKVRLGQHIAYFCEVAASSDVDSGRKLGFIAQEMGREINTLGSKANHSAMQRLVVVMKDELEKIKEQLLNVL